MVASVHRSRRADRAQRTVGGEGPHRPLPERDGRAAPNVGRVSSGRFVRSMAVPIAASIALLGSVAIGAGQAHAGPHAASTLRVGTKELHSCGGGEWCGTLAVPLDHTDAASPTITVCFGYWPATSGSSEGTVLPVEGGPGYSSLGSVGGSGGYQDMFGSQLRDHNMLVVDLRGTGCSTPIDCPTLQNWTGPTGTTAYDQATGACAASLNDRWKYSTGGWVQGSSLFTSAESADDVAQVLGALDIAQVTIYGDSYGSWFAQVFAADHPQLVSSVILDSTYQVQSLDPWYRTSVVSMPADQDLVCADTPSCAAFGSSAWTRIGQVAARLRAAPIAGAVPGPNGTLTTTTMNVVGLVDLVNDATEDPAIYATLDAGDRALLDENDPAPLLRLYAGRTAVDEWYFGVPPSTYSVGLYAAVSCSDYPQLYSMESDPSARPSQLAAAIASLPATTFQPFSTSEWIAMDQNTESYTACLDWPVPTSPVVPVPDSPPFLASSVPVLILGGQLDIWTPPLGVPEVQAELGGNSRFVLFANETHVVGEEDSYGCASSIIQDFVADPRSLQSLDVSCAAAVPTLRAAATYPTTLAATPPANDAALSIPVAQLVSASIETAGDEWVRMSALGLSHDVGLYGGRTAVRGSTLTLKHLSLIPGAAISGTVTTSGANEDTVIHATLSASMPGGNTIRLVGTWPAYGGDASASVTVTSAGSTSLATLAAPVGAPY